jgi:hypothetical protein
MREIFIGFEDLIENHLGADRIKNKEMGMYKGTVKKWQVLDDKVVDRE